MSVTSRLSDEERVELLQQHDGCLEALALNRTERRKRGVRATRAAIEQHLFDVGMRIAKDNLDKPVYGTAKDFLDANLE